MTRKRHKPRGKIGPFTVHPDGQTEFHPIELPQTKDEIENAILVAALNSKDQLDLRLFYGLTAEPTRNPEDHFDFTLTTASGVKYLDLMEVAPLAASGGSYEKVGNVIKLADQMDALYAEIKRKGMKYGKSPRASIHLLLYATDFRFDIFMSGSDLLAHQLNRRDHRFATVLFCSPQEADRVSMRILFPLSKAELGLLEDEAMLRSITQVHFHPASGDFPAMHVIPKPK